MYPIETDISIQMGYEEAENEETNGSGERTELRPDRRKPGGEAGSKTDSGRNQPGCPGGRPGVHPGGIHDIPDTGRKGDEMFRAGGRPGDPLCAFPAVRLH